MAKSRARAAGRAGEFFDVYTKDVSGGDLQKLFTRDAREAYRFFARPLDDDQLARLSWPKRTLEEARLFLMAFSSKLSPARRVLYGVALFAGVLGFAQLWSGFEMGRIPLGGFSLPLPLPVWPDGAWLLFGSVLLLNLLVVVEVADRLSLKNDLDIAREIQQAMLPRGTVTVGDLDVHGLTKPANTVGGDFYDVQPMTGGRLLVAVGDVAGKGSPASLLMALLLAMLRTLLDEYTDLVALTTRLNAQIVRHAPSSRFITLFLAAYDPDSGQLEFVNAGHPPAMLRRRDGTFERLNEGGIALGMFDGSTYESGSTVLGPGDRLVIYSDGITEAEDPANGFFDEVGLERALTAGARLDTPALCQHVLETVKRHVGDARLTDDLTLLVLSRAAQSA